MTDDEVAKTIVVKPSQSQVILYVLAVLSFLGMLGLGIYNVRITDCLEEYAKADASAARERIEASEQTALAMDQLVNEVLGSSNREQTRAALEHYREVRAEEMQKRRENPIPEPPNRFCN